MILTGKHLSRRTFLKGAGVSIALPFLDSMVPAFATQEQMRAPTRLAFAYVPNGAIMQHWTPTAQGADYKMSRILAPFEPHRREMVVLSGLGHGQRPNANGAPGNPGGHATAGALYLTSTPPKKTIGTDVQSGVSIDQVIARSVANQTRFASLELSCDDTRAVGNCDSGYNCVYSNTISWRTPTSPLSPETNPRSVFERLFGNEDPNLTVAQRARRASYRSSILDLVGDRAQSLTGTLGAADQRKIDEFLHGIREIEQRIQRVERDQRAVEPGIARPDGIPIEFADHLRLMFDLLLLAFQSDMTRVSTLIIGREGSLRTYREIGVPESHHPLTHHRNNPEFIEKVAQINCYHTRLFAQFIDKLKRTPDGDGTLLDHCAIVYGSGISEANEHLHTNLPAVVFGAANGRINAGRHLLLKHPPMSNLFVSLMDCMGMHQESFGDSTGRVEGLLRA